MTGTSIAMLATMTVYLFAMIGVGIKLSERNETAGDFFLGGRKLGPLVTAMSAEASDMSSYLLLGIPGAAYLSGLADASWTCIGLAIGTYLNWLLVAKKLRRYSERIQAITVPSFFSNRYNDKKNILTLIAAIVIIVFFVPYTASGFAACGKLFNSLFGLDYHAAMIISAIVIMFYTSMGGFLAASTTDFMQSIIMTIALLVIVFFGAHQAGGWGAVIENAKAIPGYMSMNHMYSGGEAVYYGPITVISTLAWGLGYFGMPHILLRFMAVKDDSKLGLSRRVATTWVVISMGIAILIGIVGFGCSANGVIDALEGSASETVIVKLSHLMSTYGIPAAIVGGIVLSGILASTMSTSDSQLLAASSSVSNDILVNFLGLEISNKKALVISRLSLIVIALIGVIMAWNPNSSVFTIVSFAWAGFGAAFGPVMILALFWRRSNRQGAIAGMIGGGLMVFIWKFAIRPKGGVCGIYELLPAFVVAFIINIIVSLLTPAPEKEITDIFDEVKAQK